MKISRELVVSLVLYQQMINLNSIIDQVKREDFLSLAFLGDIKNLDGYKDTRIPIGFGQNATKPSVVKKMINLAIEGLPRCDTVLEVGTGCGWQTAILANIFKSVLTAEIHEELSRRAQRAAHEYKNITFVVEDAATIDVHDDDFDAILVGTCFKECPENLLRALKQDGGRIIIPLGNSSKQILFKIERDGNNYTYTECGASGFVLAQTGNTEIK